METALEEKPDLVLKNILATPYKENGLNPNSIRLYLEQALKPTPYRGLARKREKSMRSKIVIIILPRMCSV